MTELVLLHGIGGPAWGEIPGAFPQARSWNLPGYGGAPLGPQGFAGWAAALAASLGEARVDLLGHSIGGMLAQEFFLSYPERVRSLILYATTPAFGGRDPAFAEEFLRDRLAPLDTGRNMASLAAEMMPAMLQPGAPAGAAEHAAAVMAGVPEAAYRETVTTLTTFNRRDDLARITAPTLLLAAERDALAPPRTMQRMADAMPNARLVTLEGAGHLAHLEQPAAFVAAVRDFLHALPEG